MRRRIESPGAFNVWPAFTDVLGGLVVVLIFLITVFVIGEVLIGREITGKDTAIEQLTKIKAQVERLLGKSEDEKRDLKIRVDLLKNRLHDRGEDIRQLRERLSEAQLSGAALEESLATVQANEKRVREKLAISEEALEGSERTRLAQRQELDRSAAKADLEAAMLSEQIGALAAELERLNRALQGSRETAAAAEQARAQAEQRITALESTTSERDADIARRETIIEEQRSRIDEMDRLIKRRLLERVEELEQYSSDFFGRLRRVFANNPDIKVVGDRFVFQSEVLFPSGEAELSGGGRGDLDKFVEVYRQLESEIPRDLPVIIEVQGHTDRVPISTSEFRSNWELSSHRALGVVNYFIERGIPPGRLAAVGMGEYHPIEASKTAEAYRRNRRIELKITSR